MTTPSAQTNPLPPRSLVHTQRKKRPLWLKIGLTVILLVAAVVAGFAVYLYLQVDSAIDTVGVQTEAPIEKPADDKPIAVMLLGKDTRQETGSLNTDVIMVATLNPNTKSATVVSVPRDTLVQVKGVRSAKANSYYANFYKSDKSTANRETKQLFGQYLGIPIDYMAIVDFHGFEEIIDKLGGLPIDVDMDMCYRDRSDGTNIQLSKGPQTLNGKQTLDFVRYRSSNCGTAPSNDIQRNERQQQVLSKTIDKLKSFGTVTRLGGLIETVARYIQTDIPSQQIKTMIGTYIGIERDKIKYIHLQGKWKSPYIYIDEIELDAARDALREQLRE